MRWGSLETFLVESAFWQEMMGKPVANRDFLKALLHHGTFDDYHFFCPDRHHLTRFRMELDRLFQPADLKRVRVSLQAEFGKEAAERPFDILHQGDFTYFMPFLVEYRNRMDPGAFFPVSGVTHSLDGAWMQTRLLQLLLARPEPWDVVFCTSVAARRFLETALNEVSEAFMERFGIRIPERPELVQVPLAISDTFFENRDRAGCRAALGLPPDRFVMLSLGRFSVRHKADLSPLFECVEWLKRTGALPDFKLILAGSGSAEDIRLISDLVDRLGLRSEVVLEANVAPDRKLLLYGAADLFVSIVDNYQETLGLTLIEAMAHGLPVVASDFSGYRDLVTHGRTGFLIPTAASPDPEPWESLLGLLDPSVVRLYTAQKVSVDLSELASALSTLARNPVLRTAMSLRARVNAARYRWPRVIESYEAIWTRQAADAQAARKATNAASSGRPLLIPRYATTFAHFPTLRMDSGTRIVLSDYGKERVRHGFEPVLYEEMRALMPSSLRERMIEVLDQGETTVDALVAALLGTPPPQVPGMVGQPAPAATSPESNTLSRATVLLQLDWLSKHGYIKIL